MDHLSLYLALAPAALLALSQLRPFLFGRKELDEAQNEARELKAKLEKAEAKLEENRDKTDKLAREAAALRAENLDLKSRKKDNKEEAKRIARLERDLADKAQEIADRNNRHEAVVRTMHQEILEYQERVSRATEEARKAREELAAVQEQMARKEKAAQERREERREERVVEAPKPVVNLDELREYREKLDRLSKNLERANDKNKILLEELKAARTGNEPLQIRIADLEAVNRVLRRKVEANRRAYIITESQLEVALDDLYFQKHGKPRRETDGVRLGRPEAEAMAVEDLANEVEEPAEAAPEAAEAPEAPEAAKE